MSDTYKIDYKGKKIDVLVNHSTQINLGYSGKKVTPREGDKLLYISNKGRLGLCIFLGIKPLGSVAVLKSDVLRYGDHPSYPTLSYVSDDHLRILNWNDNEFPQKILDEFKYTTHQ